MFKYRNHEKLYTYICVPYQYKMSEVIHSKIVYNVKCRIKYALFFTLTYH